MSKSLSESLKNLAVDSLLYLGAVAIQKNQKENTPYFKNRDELVQNIENSLFYEEKIDKKD